MTDFVKDPGQPLTAVPRAARGLRIGPFRFALPAVQAALSGYSDLAMRRVARARGAPYALNEVVIDEHVLTRGKGRRRILDLEPDDHPVGGQLMGARPRAFAAAAREMVRAGYDVLDVNFGCPVSKVLGRCRGGYLLGTPEVALEIVDRVMEAAAGEVPVTVKMRRGIDDTAGAERAFFTIFEGVLERGVAAVTVHGRTVAQKYVGPSDTAFLARVVRRAGGRTVLVSGDLFTPYDVRDVLEATGADGVTLARGCIGNPFLFGQVRDLLAGRVPRRPLLVEQGRAIGEHLDHALSCHGARGPGRTRTHAIQYARHHPDPIGARDAFVAVRSEEAMRAVVDEWYDPDRFGAGGGPLSGNGR